MSKVLSVRMYLKRQKKDAEGKVPIYVQVTIDGDEDSFSLSRKLFPHEWSQGKQKCIGKSKEALLINAKITKTKGDLTAVFDRIPVAEMVKAKPLIKLYHGQDPDKEQVIKKDIHYHQKILAIIDQYLILKTREKKALQKLPSGPLPAPIQEDRQIMTQNIEGFLQQSHSWMDDPTVDKTLMDAQYAFLLKFLYKVLKGTASHETFRKWISTKNTFASFLKYRYKISDQSLKNIPLKFADDLYEYLTLTHSIGNNGP